MNSMKLESGNYHSLFLKEDDKMHIKKNIVSENAKTELQWNRLGYKVKKNTSGIEAWSNCYCGASYFYYESDEVELMTDDDKKKFKDKEKEKRKRSLQEKLEREKRIEQRLEYLRKWKTAVQWLLEGFVPFPSARWVTGEELNGNNFSCKGSNYYYCYIDDVTEDKEKAQKLLDKYDNENDTYDGRAWW